MIIDTETNYKEKKLIENFVDETYNVSLKDIYEHIEKNITNIAKKLEENNKYENEQLHLNIS